MGKDEGEGEGLRSRYNLSFMLCRKPSREPLRRGFFFSLVPIYNAGFAVSWARLFRRLFTEGSGKLLTVRFAAVHIGVRVSYEGSRR